MFELPGKSNRPLPYLAYAQGAYLGQMVEMILKRSSAPIHFDRVYETDMAEGLKAMALEGHGIAFLPYSAVRKELRSKKLVSAATKEMTGLEITLDIRIYRERPHAKQEPKGTAQALWKFLSKT
jgi:DNA-binding transcriptional LysR family regulator